MHEHVDAAVEIAAEPAVTGHAKLRTTVIADAGTQVQLAIARGLLGDDLDGATVGVAPVQRALRPAQNLNSLDVGEIEIVDRLTRHVDVVHVETNRGIGRGEVFRRTDGAHEEGRRRRLTDVAVTRQVRNVENDLLGIEHLATFDDRRIDGRDRNRRCLEALFSTLSGDRDFFERDGLIVGLLRRSSR